MTGIRHGKDAYKHRAPKQGRRDKWMHKHRQEIIVGVIYGILIVVIMIFLGLF